MAVSDDEIKEAIQLLNDWDFGELYDLLLVDDSFDEKEKVFSDYIEKLASRSARYGAAHVVAEVKQEGGIIILAGRENNTDEVSVYIDALSVSVPLKSLIKTRVQRSGDEAQAVIELLRAMLDEIEAECL